MPLRRLLLLLIALGPACQGGAGDTAAPLPLPAGSGVDAALPYWMVVVPASLEGAASRPFLLDTGASHLLLTPAAAEPYSLEVVSELGLADRTFEDVPFVSHDLELVSSLLDVELAGNIGQDVISHMAVAIDYQAGRVHLLDDGAARWDLGAHVVGAPTDVPVQLAEGGLHVATARFEELGRAVPVVIDSGTNCAVLSESLAEELGFGSDGRTVLEGRSGLGGLGSPTELVRLRAIDLGGAVARDTWASVSSDRTLAAVSDALGTEVEAILGGTFLREFHVLVDGPGQALRLSTYADLDHVPEEYTSLGVEVLRDDGGWRVFTVFTGSGAEEAGVALGDTLVSVDGQALADLPLAQVLPLLRGEDGDTRTVVFEGEEGTVTAAVPVRALLPEE